MTRPAPEAVAAVACNEKRRRKTAAMMALSMTLQID
jgi:hypothetical protein